MKNRQRIIICLAAAVLLLLTSCSSAKMSPYEYLCRVRGDDDLLLAEDGTVWISDGPRGIGRLSGNPVKKEILACQWTPEKAPENEVPADDISAEISGFEGTALKFNVSNNSETSDKYISAWLSVQLEDEWYAVIGAGVYELYIQLEAGEAGEYEISFSCSPEGSGYLPSGHYRLNIRDGTKYIRREFDAEIDSFMHFSGEAYSFAADE